MGAEGDSPAAAGARARSNTLGVSLLWMLLMVALAAYGGSRLEVTSDIGHFLPDGDEDWGAEVSRRLLESEAGQRLVLLLGGADVQTLGEASDALAAKLRAVPEILRVDNGIGPEAQRAAFELYFAHRHALFSEQPEREYGRLLSNAGLREAARRLVRQLGSVEGSVTRRLAPRDPLQTFPKLLRRLRAGRTGELELVDGRFFDRTRDHAVLFVRTRDSALDAPVQRRVLARIDDALATLRASHGAGLSLQRSGAGRYAAHAERSIRRDIQRVGGVSLAAIVVLLLVAFRSLRVLWAVALPLGFGILLALAVTLGLLGEIHGATLAFGATLIGVCLDYPAHVLSHHALGPPTQSARATVRAIWPAILLGGLTTLAGLFGLSWAAFAGIREMALFTGVGVVGALIATRHGVPAAAGTGGRASARLRGLASALAALAQALRRRPVASRAVLALAATVAFSGLPTLRFEDDLAGWMPASETLRAEDARVMERVAAPDPGKLVVARGPDLESALQVNDRIAAALGEAREAGEVSEFRSLHALLWSRQLQQRNQAALRGVADLPERMRAAFGEDFQDDAFAPFFRELAEPPPPPLRLEALLTSALAPAASAFLLSKPGAPGGVQLATYLHGVRDPAALARRVERVEGARYFDQRAFLDATYGAFRLRTLELIAVGLLLVWSLLWVRYRAARTAVAAFLPAALAALGALSILSLAGVSLDLFHVVGLLLVLSVGVDYGIFIVEGDDPARLGATLVGLVVACLSTLLSFGLLALSEIPALRSLGQVTGVGVLLALLWSPTALVLHRPREVLT